jgi:pyrroline-5-carboxylate reductase
LAQQFGIHAGTDNGAAVAQSDIVVLAVKPQVMRGVALAIAAAVAARRPLIISVAAGIRIESLMRWFGTGAAVIRVMPNMPALIGAGATALVANANVTAVQREQAEAVMRAVGLTVWLEQEMLLDTVTALSGSGPAYVFLLMEALERAAIERGLPADQARLLTMQTVFGAAKLALEADAGPDELRQQVTSPGGTTERALRVLAERGFAAAVAAALAAAQTRAAELAAEFGSA